MGDMPTVNYCMFTFLILKFVKIQKSVCMENNVLYMIDIVLFPIFIKK